MKADWEAQAALSDSRRPNGHPAAPEKGVPGFDLASASGHSPIVGSVSATPKEVAGHGASTWDRGDKQPDKKRITAPSERASEIGLLLLLLLLLLLFGGGAFYLTSNLLVVILIVVLVLAVGGYAGRGRWS